MNTFSSFSQDTALVKTNSFIRSVYNWMAIALALTGFTAYYVAHNETLFNLFFYTPGLMIMLIIAELGFVFFLAARIQKIKAGTATMLFTVYSILNGITMSYIFIRFTDSSIASTFAVCALTFGACSIYGMVTKKDLTSLGGFMMMGLIGIIIATVVNIFVQSSAMQMIISYIGVMVFMGLTAYDTQKLKTMSATMPDNATGSMIRKGAIMGALALYLDFINLFIMLLHILGGSRD
ncbi:MAG: Bax inhibitor-1/YccA family protein [Proteobacteria bacterium]|nr:Bax inhibitor-1/YccA family protein [Pseudomonadota bacterium]MBU1388276.1 Bax inhibitor-1/YccA family protein [Pseudomonadota bacterium]MBU1544675.1 Bax inhibitor-1/YccA family protein [Pseudomonadota bacterium]MBU2429335.1 Bax inhibitor-1/YccA family protein [Pseudomonadota bacterium]MBU2481775.1 Bax inhibitor-1/YccA family protein [Pseudomonadota bacterium]